MSELSKPYRGPAVPQSPAEREWRSALSAAGFQVAPTVIQVHPSQLNNPRANKVAAEAAYRRFVAAEPNNLMALDGLIFLLQHRGAAAEAQQLRRQRYAAEVRNLGVPEQEIPAAVAFLASTLGDGPAPAAPPAVYVEKMFDEFSAIYDQQLVGTLMYRAPALLCAAVEALAGDRSGRLDVLDLGCGTGLAGAEFRGLAARLTGVDLSPQMLAHALQRGVYERLEQAEIVAFLNATSERFDVIVAADVLNYVGDLTPVFAGMARVLRTNGYCAITVEAGEADCRLRGTRRYQHSNSYLELSARTTGLNVERIESIELRRQFGEPVVGWLGVFRAGAR